MVNPLGALRVEQVPQLASADFSRSRQKVLERGVVLGYPLGGPLLLQEGQVPRPDPAWNRFTRPEKSTWLLRPAGFAPGARPLLSLVHCRLWPLLGRGLAKMLRDSVH